MLSFLDLAVFIVVVLSGIMAMQRGFYRTLFAFLPWIVSGAVACLLYPLAYPFIKPYVTKIETASALALAAVFLGTLVITTLTTVTLSGLVLHEKVGARNGTLGFVYGAMRGMLIAIIAFGFYSWLVPDPDQPAWVSNAFIKPVLLSSSKALREYTPDNLDSVIARITAKLAEPVSETAITETKPEKNETAPAVSGLTTPPTPDVSTIQPKPNDVSSEPAAPTATIGQNTNPLPAGATLEKTPSGSTPAPPPATSITIPTEAKPDKAPSDTAAAAPSNELLPKTPTAGTIPEKTTSESAAASSSATPMTSPVETKPAGSSN